MFFGTGSLIFFDFNLNGFKLVISCILDVSSHKIFYIVELQDINNLISNQTPESKSLEYKGKMEGKEEKSAINKAVCGFANADGGLFIYGLEEDENKIPTKIDGISLKDSSWDDKKRSILSTIENNIEPRVDVEVKEIESRELMLK